MLEVLIIRLYDISCYVYLMQRVFKQCNSEISNSQKLRLSQDDALSTLSSFWMQARNINCWFDAYGY